jgi:hypothetical protein
MLPGLRRYCCTEEAGDHRRDRHDQCNNRTFIEPISITISALHIEESGQIELLFAQAPSSHKS